MVALTDAGGMTVATYHYDTFGTPTSWEAFTTGWHNSFRYDGRDGVRYDSETGLSWMRVRAYDPTLGRFISRDPLGRVPLFFADQPYAYAGNNPLVNVDPSGQRRQTLDGGDWTTPPPPSPTHTANWGRHARILTVPGLPQRSKRAKTGPSWLLGISAFLVVNGSGLLQAVKEERGKAKVDALLDELERTIQELRYRLPWKKIWKSKAFRRGMQGIEAQEATNRIWEVFGKALIAVGFVVDAFQYYLTYYYSSYRPDLPGTTRAVVALIAGVIHGLFVTAATVLSDIAASLLGGPVVGWIVGFGVGMGASALADLVMPRLVDVFVEEQALA